MTKPSTLTLKNGGVLAYHKSEGASPGVIFLGGFRSDMTGVKALAFEKFCRKRGQAFLRFDYQGHGESSGNFEDGTIGLWAQDALAALSKLTKGPQILVGSSMGGWIALLLAIYKPKRVAGVIGIAAAPDFTDNVYYDRLTPKQQQELMKKGKIMVPSDSGASYPITRAFVEDGRRHFLLGGEIPVKCPVRLLHGIKDDVVPWEISLAINEKLASEDVKTLLIENGDHRLSTPQDIEKLLATLEKLLQLL